MLVCNRPGLQMTTRRIIDKVQSLDAIQTVCRDGNCLLWLVPVDEEQALLPQILAHVLAGLRILRWPHLPHPAGESLCVSLALPPPKQQPFVS